MLSKILVVIMLLALTIAPVEAAEVCVGDPGPKTVDLNEEFSFCWDLGPESDLIGYSIYVSKDGGASGVHEGAMTVGAVCGAGPGCLSPKYKLNEVGTYVFTIKAFDDFDEEPSGPSDPLTLIVENKAPSKPTGCSFSL